MGYLRTKGRSSWVPSASPSKKKDRIDVVKDCLAIAQSIVTIGAIVAAGYWFLVQGADLAAANISLKATDYDASNGAALVSVVLTFTNSGKRPVKFDYVKARVQEVLPLDKVVSEAMAKKLDDNLGLPFWGKAVEVHGYRIGPQQMSDAFLNIAPGETDSKTFEFIVPTKHRVIRIYAEAKEVPDMRPWYRFWRDQREDLVWIGTLVYELKTGDRPKPVAK